MKLSLAKIFTFIAIITGLPFAFNNCAPGGFDAGTSQEDDPGPKTLAPPEYACALSVGDADCPGPAPIEVEPLPESPPPSPPSSPIPTNADPGIGSGLWVPNGHPYLFVVDQSGTNITTSYIPGCLNGTMPGSSSWSGCAADRSFIAKGVRIEIIAGNILSVRYMSRPNAGTSKKFFTLSGFDGGPTGEVYVWLTENPLSSYEATDPKCKSYSATTPGIVTGVYKLRTGETITACPIKPNTVYYLNITTNHTFPNGLKIFEDSSDMLP